MAEVMEKLYPPTISSSIPAFYAVNGTARVAVPFSMNKAVSRENFDIFILKIKTVQSNRVVKTLKSAAQETNGFLVNRIAEFNWPIDDTVKPGQFFKFQLAYGKITMINNEPVVTPGYFSTVAVGKLTAQPTVVIKNVFNTDDEQNNTIGIFKQTYIGSYTPGAEDKTERPYSYIFNLYDQGSNELIETSGWLLHNSSVNNLESESLSIDETIDKYSFLIALDENKTYLLQYQVKTINNLIISSPMYACQDQAVGNGNAFPYELKAQNVFEEGYIKLNLKYNDSKIITEDPSFVYAFHEISIEIRRAEKTDNYQAWKVLKRVLFTAENGINTWELKDFTIEQGVHYIYSYRAYNENGLYTQQVESDVVYADFEDMFLYDGERQLKIRFNPKVSSFKTTRLESKTDTIGNQYPFIFRNGIVNYKEFPISGLISYLTDNNELFINHREDLNIILGRDSSRKCSPHEEENDVSTTDLLENIDSKSWEVSETLDSLGYNIRAERRFKLKLLEWLNDGKIKLFRSPAEGNYLVRLMNISLSPEDKLGRMLHNFSATAYEIEELNYENLINLNFIQIEEKEKIVTGRKSIYFKDAINAFDGEIIRTSIIPINDADIVNYLTIEPAPTALNTRFFIRLDKKQGQAENRFFCTTNQFSYYQENADLPDVWISVEDNEVLFDANSNKTFKEKLLDLVGDAILTFDYKESIQTASQGVGENQISDITIKNKIHTLVGPLVKTYETTMENNVTEEVLRFLVLDFQPKNIITVNHTGSDNNIKWYYGNDTTYRIQNFDIMSLYREGNNLYYGDGTATPILVTDQNPFLAKVYYNNNTSQININVNPNSEHKINTNIVEQKVSKIELGQGTYLQCAYQVKITTYVPQESSE